MASDLTDRLRAHAAVHNRADRLTTAGLLREAAAEIERLTAAPSGGMREAVARAIASTGIDPIDDDYWRARWAWMMAQPADKENYPLLPAEANAAIAAMEPFIQARVEAAVKAALTEHGI